MALDADYYKQYELQLLSRSENCSDGNTWVWDHVAQCLDEPIHTLGFMLGGIAIVLSSIMYLCLSLVQTRRPNNAHTLNVLLATNLNLLSEALGLLGALLSIQLPTQIMYSVVLIPVHVICCALVCNGLTKKRNQNRVKGGKKSSASNKCAFPFRIFLPIFLVTMVIAIRPWTESAKQQRSIDVHPLSSNQITDPEYLMIGYILGSLSGLLLCSARIFDLLYMYRSMDNSQCVSIIYVTSALSGICYIGSIFSQSITDVFLRHTIPWIYPRLVTTGLDVGILIQRIIYKRNNKQKRLSVDTKSLLSSDDELEEYFSDSGSEEIVWMPLKMMESVQPYQQVSVSRVQIISESDHYTTDLDEDRPEEYTLCGIGNNEDEYHYGSHSINNIGTEIDEESNRKTEAHQSKEHTEEVYTVKRNEVQVQNKEERYDFQEDRESSGDSSSDSSEEPIHPPGSNSIIKQNILTLSEVKKDERIVSWIKTNS